MKAKVFSKTGKEIKEVELPKWFSENIREDLCQRYFEISKRIQPYGPFYLAGKLHSACGILKHARHQWKTTYGHGISRVPRKIMWRRGNQFYWIGAGVSSTRGGRRVHAPQPIHFTIEKKMNKKEKMIAIKSALIATVKEEWIKKRYETLKNKKISTKLPIIIEKEILKLKSKEFLNVIKKILSEFSEIVLQKKKKKAGKGKLRKGKYRKTAGLLLIIGKNESTKLSGIDVINVNKIDIKDLWPLGRLTIYTEEAIKELNNIGGKNV
ncbi:MAG: 50S ribosomal protein L4 [Candidatus Pacearchaeota archaeon]